ncbi:MAG: MoaD/ThiS family protein [Anaerolineaceae bacterium]|nr:MoaD/ThiS family protein [Anaerolineaceae bacterium]
MNNIKILVEFTGISRILTGKMEYQLPLVNGAVVRDVVRAIGRKFPPLVGEVIEEDGETLVPTNLFSVNGKQILNEKNMHYQPKDGDRLILLSLLAGG